MKYFLDTEFSERGHCYPVELISIGIVAEDGREFYRENKQLDHLDLEVVCNEWVRKNVLPHLTGEKAYRDQIAKDIIEFVGTEKAEFWGYFADYDWVVFAQIFGTMMDLPKNFPMYCRDIKQLCDSLGNPKLPEQGKGEHNALADARWNKTAYDFLIGLRNES